MLGLNTKIALWLGIALAAFLCLWWGISQYGKVQVVQAKAEVTEKAVQGAVEDQKSSAKADVRARVKRRAVLDPVRTSGITVEKTIAETNVPPALDPEYLRVLNSSISQANTAIAAARVMRD